MTIIKIAAFVLLAIMATTWSIISCKLGVMVAVSDNFMYLSAVLGSVLFGENVISRFKK